MGMRIGTVAVVISLASTARSAWADIGLEVERDAASEDCPDAARVRMLAAKGRNPLSASPAHTYRISFARLGELYRVKIVDETAHRARRLQDVARECAPIGHAAALVLATMWDSEGQPVSAEEAEPPPSGADVADAGHAQNPEPPAPPPPPVQAGDAGVAPTITPGARPRWFASAGSGLAFGIVRPFAPLLLLNGGIESTHASLAIGGLWIPQQTLGLAPGAVNVQLISADARACGFLFHKTRLGACANTFAGALIASAQGFATILERRRPWFALGLEAFVEGMIPPSVLRYRLSAEAVVPVHAEVFTVAGAGSAYETPPLGVLVTLAIEMGERPPAEN